MEMKKITRPHLILCEGRDEERFFISYINSKERIADDKRFDTDVQVINFGGNEELPRFLKMLPVAPGFSKVKTILIARDAENSVDDAVLQVQAAIKNAGLIVPERPCEWKNSKDYAIAFVLFPTLSTRIENGTLENFCMKILKTEYNPDAVLKELTGTMANLERQELRTFPHDFKTKLHGFFTLTDKFVGLKIGEASDSGAFDWGSEEFKELNRLLIEGFGIID